MARILVVDDEPEVARALRRVLSFAQFEVDIALDGASALEIFDRVRPDLVISDSRMPGMTGEQLIQEIRRRSPRTACLILSGYTEPSSSAEAGEADCERLSKPWDRAHLLERIRAALDRSAEPPT